MGMGMLHESAPPTLDMQSVIHAIHSDEMLVATMRLARMSPQHPPLPSVSLHTMACCDQLLFASAGMLGKFIFRRRLCKAVKGIVQARLDRAKVWM